MQGPTIMNHIQSTHMLSADSSSDEKFYEILEGCRTAAGTYFDLLSKSLHELEAFLGQLRKTTKNVRNDGLDLDSNSLDVHSPAWDEYATALLYLEIVRTGAPSESQIQDQIDDCLDLCGYRIPFLSALNIIGNASDEERRRSLGEVGAHHAEQSDTIASIQASLHLIRRVMVTLPDGIRTSQTSNPKCQCLLRDFFPTTKDKKCGVVALEKAAKYLVNLVTLLPSQIANACHRHKLQLPAWCTRSKMLFRLVECAAYMAFISTNDENLHKQMDKGYDDLCPEETNDERVETIYLSALLQKLVHNGSSELAASGLHKFWTNYATHGAEKSAKIIAQAASSIISPRHSATFLLSMIKHTISKVELYSADMSQGEIDSICQEYCMPYLRLVCTPVLTKTLGNEILLIEFVKLTILNPPRTGDLGEMKLISRCVVLLLVQCDEVFAEDRISNMRKSDEGTGDSDDDDDDDDEAGITHNEHDFSRGVLLKSLVDVAMIWSETSFINLTDHLQQRHVTSFILNAIDFIYSRSDTEMQQVVVQGLLSGITNRLKVKDTSIRMDGMMTGEKLSLILGETIRFEELDGTREQEKKDHSSQAQSQLKPIIEPKKGKARAKKHHKKEIRPKEIDPDEDYFTEDDESDCDKSSSECSESVYSSDSEWDEDELMTYNMKDDEDDLMLVPKPNYLRECLDLLRANGDDIETSCKHETSLKQIPLLVREMPPDLQDLASSLVKEVLRMENKFNLDSFEDLRQNCLCALTSCEPIGTVEYFQNQIFEEGIAMGERIEILEVLKYCSLEMSGHFDLEEHRKLRREQADTKISRVAGKRSLIPDNLLEDKNAALQKTRRWGRGRRGQEEVKSVTNRFGPLAPGFFYPLLKNFADSRENNAIWGGETGGILLSHFLIVLSTFVDSSGFNPGTPVLAQDLVELSWSFFIAENPEVRKSVLIAVATCLPYLPPDYIAQMIVGNNQLPKVLTRAAEFDSNSSVRTLASIILEGLKKSVAITM